MLRAGPRDAMPVEAAEEGETDRLAKSDLVGEGERLLASESLDDSYTNLTVFCFGDLLRPQSSFFMAGLLMVVT